MPDALQFTNGNTTNYMYDAAGAKLSVTYQTAVAGITIPMTSVMTPLAATNIFTSTTTDYCGNVIYENGVVSRILTEEGYITLSGATPTYHYYLKDHQGNNRVVLSQSGTVEQVNHYYPFGGLFGESANGATQPYKYNGKELDRMHGLDLFDYGVRHYDATLGRWFAIDPMAEEEYEHSLYSYVANNPINYEDPTGMFRTKFGAWLYKLFNGGEQILRDKGGEFFVSSRVENTGDEPGITIKRTFDSEGRTQGRDLAFESALNAYTAQMRFKEMALQHGFEYYETNSRSEAIASLLQPATMVVLPNPFIKNINNAINTGKTESQGAKSLGAAGKGFNKVLQSGGQKLNPSTLKALNLTKEQGRNAIHALKREFNLPNNFHGKIMGNGDYIHPNTGKVIGNLFNYVY